RYYWKSHYLAELSPEVCDVLAQHTWPLPTAGSYTIVFLMGGEVGRFGPDESAFGVGRSARFAVNVNAVAQPDEDFDASVQWCRDAFDALEPHASGTYTNFLDQGEQDRVAAAYGPATFDRLRALKARYDPDNFFRMNQNIPPA
ncbi:MAG TPA: BBE domain-containing protein, partial [Actinomycetota bacterium]|nr:BBE domain-containing protein [Actinomycetota bacterium]